VSRSLLTSYHAVSRREMPSRRVRPDVFSPNRRLPRPARRDAIEPDPDGQRPTGNGSPNTHRVTATLAAGDACRDSSVAGPFRRASSSGNSCSPQEAGGDRRWAAVHRNAAGPHRQRASGPSLRGRWSHRPWSEACADRPPRAATSAGTRRGGDAMVAVATPRPVAASAHRFGREPSPVLRRPAQPLRAPFVRPAAM